MMRDVVRTSLAFAIVLSFGACGDDSGSNPGTPDGPVNVDTGTYHKYVLTNLTLPTMNTAGDYSFDLDGIGAAKDNKLGSILSLIGATLQTNVDANIQDGTIVILNGVRADALTSDDSVSWQVWLGNTPVPAAAPALDASYTVNPAGPTDARVIGAVDASGVFEGHGGKVSLSLPLVADAAPLNITLWGAGLRAKVSDMEFVDVGATDRARLGGAITQKDMVDVVLPAIAMFATLAMADDSNNNTTPDCDCSSGSQVCEDGTTASTLAGFLDGNMDCTVTVTEIQMSSVAAFLKPDVDLFKGAGPCDDPNTQTGCDLDGSSMNFAPGQEDAGDGYDSVSLGVGIQGIRAMFPIAGE